MVPLAEDLSQIGAAVKSVVVQYMFCKGVYYFHTNPLQSVYRNVLLSHGFLCPSPKDKKVIIIVLNPSYRPSSYLYFPLSFILPASLSLSCPFAFSLPLTLFSSLPLLCLGCVCVVATATLSQLSSFALCEWGQLYIALLLWHPTHTHTHTEKSSVSLA